MSPARTNRIHLIRRRAIGGAVAVFVAAWGVIGVQLASGHDPALSSSGSSTTGSTSTTTSTSPSTSDQSQLTTSDQPSQDVSPVTTSQS
jgi:hypothetical protein